MLYVKGYHQQRCAGNNHIINNHGCHCTKSTVIIQPGQFIILRVDDEGERIPLTIAGYDREKGTVTIIFQVVGGTTLLLDSLQPGDSLPTFTGGLVGYFAYDYLGYSEPKARTKAQDTENFKDVDLMLFDQVIAFDNLKQKIVLIVNMEG